MDLTQSSLNPPEEAAPIEEPVPEQPEVPTESAPEVAVASANGVPSTSASFHFMQESELENATPEGNQDWVEVPRTEDGPALAEVTATITETYVADDAIVEQTVTITTEPAAQVRRSSQLTFFNRLK